MDPGIPAPGAGSPELGRTDNAQERQIAEYLAQSLSKAAALIRIR